MAVTKEESDVVADFVLKSESEPVSFKLVKRDFKALSFELKAAYAEDKFEYFDFLFWRGVTYLSVSLTVYELTKELIVEVDNISVAINHLIITAKNPDPAILKFRQNPYNDTVIFPAHLILTKFI